MRVKMDLQVRKTALCALLLAGLMPWARAQASVMHDASYNTGVYTTLDDQYQGAAMWMNAVRAGQTVQFSAVRIDPWYAVTAAHPLWTGSDVATSAWGGFGDNIVGNPGLEVGIDEMHFHPTWNGNLTQVLANGWADLAVIKFDEPVPGPTIDIGSLALGEMFDTVGFGRPGTPGLGWLTEDKERRAFHQYADTFGSSIAGTNYVRNFFEPLSNRNDLLAGGGSPGASGGGGFNSSGDLTTLVVAGVGAPGYLMSTYSLRLDLYDPWIQTIVPEPSTLSLLLLSVLALKRRHR